MKPAVMRQNNLLSGIIMAILLPLVIGGLVFSVDWLTYKIFGFNLSREKHYLYLLSMIGNLFAIRYYFVKLNYEKTGMGFLLVTTAAIITYFYFYQAKGF